MANLIKANDANELWQLARDLIESEGDASDSRVGSTKEVLQVLFELSQPIEKWVYKRTPPISVSFALVELMWIVSGCQDSDIIDFFNPAYKKFTADEGKDAYHGAYGRRLRISHGVDQLERAYLTLKNNPNSRQVVMLLWDSELDTPNHDGSPRSKDIPCNICSMLKIRNGKLDWTQVMRSNDIVLGLPYNLVQFTGLQEIIAGWLGVEVGSYNHLSDSLHLYDKYENITDVGYNNEIKTVLNSDSLSIPKDDFDKISKDIFGRMREMMTKKTPYELQRLAMLSSKYDAYNNILLIIGANAARRYNYVPLVNKLIKECNNPIYVLLWNQWIECQNNRN